MDYTKMKNDKQQTPLEWFHQKTWALKIQLELGEISIGEYASAYATLYEQAKEMEMQQNANTWNNAINAVEKDKWESFEQYYNETYNGNHIVEANKMMGEGK